jgi:hypothetical protein
MKHWWNDTKQKTKVPGDKPVPVPPLAPQIPHGLAMASILPLARKGSNNKLYTILTYTIAYSFRNVAFLHTDYSKMSVHEEW